MARLNPELRAAEIVAAVRSEFKYGGWWAIMTPDERVGWEMHEHEWWHDKYSHTPRNKRHWAGYLAREMIYPFNVEKEINGGKEL